MENKINFYLHEPNADKPTPIMLVFYYGYKINENDEDRYKRLKFAVSRSVHPKDWSTEFQQLLPNCKNPKKNEINAELGALKQKVFNAYQYYRFQGQIPDIEKLKEHVFKDKPLQLYGKKTSVLKYIENYTANCDFKKNTIQNYKRLTNKIINYQKNNKTELYFETMDENLFRKFFKFVGVASVKYRKEEWLTHTHNSIADFKKILRKFFNMASKGGIKTHADYKNTEFTAVYVPTDAVYITAERLQQLIEIDLNQAGRPGLQKTKDEVIVSSMTGLRNSDWGRLGGIIEQKGNAPYIQVRTKKSRNQKVVSLPVYKPVMDIYTRYGNKFPKPQSNQKFNESVKELGKIMGWNEIVKINISRVYDTKEDRVEEYPFYQLMSSHTGRRSFATNSFLAGVNPQFIMKFTGHQKLKDFFNYIKLTASDDIDQFYKQTKHLYEPAVANDNLSATTGIHVTSSSSFRKNSESLQLHHA